MSDQIIPNNSVSDVATFKLLSEGKDITYDYEIISLSVNQAVNRISTARIVCKDGAAAEETFENSEGEDLVPGKSIEIALGYDSKDKTVFKGIVVKHSLKVGITGDSVLVVECRDAAVALTIGRHSRDFQEKKDSEIITAILKDYGKVSGKVEATQVKHPEIVQCYATDWDFILSRAEMNGQIVIVEDGTIHVRKPTTSGSPPVTLTYGSNILEIDVEMDARWQYQSATARAWDYSKQALVEANSKEPSLNKQGNLTGKKLADATGAPKVELNHSGLLSKQELQAWADAQILKSRLSKIQGRVKIQGFQDAKPDDVIKIAGMGKRFNGLAYISGLQHDIKDGTWYTSLSLGLNPKWFYKTDDVVERPAAGLVPGVRGLQVGVVLQLQDDPTKDDRVLVKVPIVDDKSKGIWARVAAADAGNKRGLFFRPEIGDEVILGFINDDPRHPVILGMLSSSKNPAPLESKDTNHEKGLVTRSAMKVLFDDEKKVITIETPSGHRAVISDEDKVITVETAGGHRAVLSDEDKEITLQTPGSNKVELSDQNKGIKLSDQNKNTVELNNSGIKLKSLKDISLEATGKLTLKATQDASLEGLNVNAKAMTQFKATGNAGAEVSTPAIAVLKGSLVQIN